MNSRISWLSLFVFFVITFSFHFHAWAASLERPNQDILTEQFAYARKQQIASVNYDLTFHFRKNSDTYSGQTKIIVALNDLTNPLSLDAKIDTIDTLKVNAQVIGDYRVLDGSIEIPAKYLSTQTIIEISYTNKFNSFGEGLQHFTDPSDGLEYIYSDSEPYAAHSFFPCFDQPNLKATYNVKIISPKEWVAIANAAVANTVESGVEKITTFQKSLLFSTYLVFIGAGNYHVWQSQWNNIPLAIFARESLKDFVDADNIFEITKKGLSFYSSYFDFTFPFPKYFQIFVPELGPGAMENPGAVTLNERMIFRGLQPSSAYLGRTNTILHEMAHMWFGDLVTMNWWNDLWLNESFATFMASLCIDKGLGQTEEAWMDFAGEKAWAYWQDQLVTTHPIVTEVADTNVSATNFDGITYGKGAATMKQLRYFVGEDKFQEGVRTYFKKYAWQNTTRNLFIQEIANAAGVSLDQWSKGWLESAGLNRIMPVWTCNSAGKIDSFSIRQEKTVSDVLLPHKTQIGFYRIFNGKITLVDQIGAAYSDAETLITEAIGRNCPDIVYLNEGDHDYAIVSLDEKSLQVVREKIDQVQAPLTRQLLWQNMYQMVRDLKLKTKDFFHMVTEYLPLEVNSILLGSAIGKYSNIRDLYWNVLTSMERDELAPALERSNWESIERSRLSINRNDLLWLDNYIRLSRTASAQQNLMNLLNDTSIDQNRRWTILVQLSRMATPGIQQMLANEAVRDPSAYGRTQAFAANVAFPDLASKQRYWTQLTDMHNNAISFSMRREGGSAFHQADHADISAAFIEPFFTLVQNFDWSGQMFMARGIFEALFPSAVCSPELLERSRAMLDSLTSLPAHARRGWLEANYELDKCIRIREFNHSNL